MKDKAFVDKYMGQFPVIFISLKDIKGINYDIAKGGLINLVKELARTFSFLQKSEVLSEDDKLDLKNLCSDAYLKDPFNQNNLTSALSFLSSCLYKHFKRQVILLIDEYDVPLAKAAAGKYHKEMFCPWDVINFVAENYEHKLNGTESYIKPGNYWNATSSSKILQEYLGYLNKSIRESLQNLVDGKSIEVKINDSMNYDDLKLHDPDDFFSLLLHTGYLTAVGNQSFKE